MINIRINDANEFFKWCLFRYLHDVHHNPRRTTKANKYFVKILNFKDIKLPVKIRDIHKIEKAISIAISVFRIGNKEKYPAYVLKTCFKENALIYHWWEKKAKGTIFLWKTVMRFVWSYFSPWKKKFLLLLFTSFLCKINLLKLL